MPSAQITYNVTKEYAEELFGLDHAYTLEELREAFRYIACECHPDMASDDADLIEREAKSRIVNMSYARLKKQFDGQGNITVKTMKELIEESHNNREDNDEILDDILDFLDDVEDDAPKVGTIPAWMLRANSIIGEKQDSAEYKQNQMNNKFSHVDWVKQNANFTNRNVSENGVTEEVKYSLPPFLRRKYLHRNESIRNNNTVTSDTTFTPARDTNQNEFNRIHTTMTYATDNDIEDEVNRIMAKIISEAGKSKQ